MVDLGLRLPNLFNYIIPLPPDNLCNEVDPSMLLLQDTTKSFHGNYSCKGKNSAGWGPESRKTELVVYCEFCFVLLLLVMIR